MGPNVIIRILRTRVRRVQRDVTVEARSEPWNGGKTQLAIAGFEDEERDGELRHKGCLQKLEEARKWVFP